MLLIGLLVENWEVVVVFAALRVANRGGMDALCFAKRAGRLLGFVPVRCVGNLDSGAQRGPVAFTNNLLYICNTGGEHRKTGDFSRFFADVFFT